MEEFRSVAEDPNVSDEEIVELAKEVKIESDEMLTELSNIIKKYRPNVYKNIISKRIPSA